MFDMRTLSSKLWAILIIFVSATIANAAEVNIPRDWDINVNDFTLNIAGDISNAGSLRLNSGKINLIGNWTNTGIFSSGRSEVTFNGSSQGQSIITGGGASAFNTLIITNSHASGITFKDALFCDTINTIPSAPVKLLSFATIKDINLDRHTIFTTFDVNGSSGNLITLAPDIPVTDWNLDAPDDSRVSFVSVNNSLQVDGKVIGALDSIDGGNNKNWVFSAPTADFSFSPISSTVPQSIQFNDLSTGNPTSWSWSFGDGASSTDQNPIHEYSAEGSFTVILAVSNLLGDDREFKTIIIPITSSTSTIVPSSTTTISSSSTTTIVPSTTTISSSSTTTPSSTSTTIGSTSTTVEPPTTSTTTGSTSTTTTTVGPVVTTTTTLRRILTRKTIIPQLLEPSRQFTDITITTFDQFNNILPGVRIELIPSNRFAVVNGNAVQNTDENGEAIFSARFRLGSRRQEELPRIVVDCTFGGTNVTDAITLPMSPEGEIRIGSKIVVPGSISPSLQFTDVTITIFDQNNDPLPDVQIELIPSNRGAVVNGEPTKNTDPNGIAMFSVRFKVPSEPMPGVIRDPRIEIICTFGDQKVRGFITKK